jgi:hypothetical protein
MRSPIAFAIATISIGIISQGFADPGGPSSGGIGLPGTNTGTGSTGASSAATPNENNTDGSDDALYRGKTGDSENPMLRDEGALHFKKRPKEKIQEVESLKNLQSSKPDPKFQGSLINSDVSSIEKVSAKANETRDAADEEDPRFKAKRLNFTPAKTDEPKKAQSDSSPSPTPSPTASPAKNSGKSKE